MTQTAEQRREAARQLAKTIFGPAVVANMNLDDLAAAIGAIDDAMDTTISTISPQNKTVKVYLAQSLPAPFSGASAQQKAVALSAWALRETGVI